MDAGCDITLASPAGGQPPLDPKSDEPAAQTDATRRFKDDKDAQNKLDHTKKLAEVQASNFDAVFYPGGHGPLWDLAISLDSIALIEDFNAQQKPIAFVCHAPAALKNVKSGDDYLVKAKKVTGFSNSEEKEVGLYDDVPFLLEDMLKDRGAHYDKGADWSSFVITDGNLVTGQNPASSEATAKALLKLLDQ